MRRVLPLLLFALAWVDAVGAQQIRVTQRAARAFESIDDALTEWFGRSLPQPSASPGVNFSFDAATGTFVREPSTFGQIYLYRADPIGKGRWNLGVSWQRAVLESIGGQSTDDLSDRRPLAEPGRPFAVRFDYLTIAAETQQITFSSTYGLTDDLDVSVAVPVVYTDAVFAAQLSAAAVVNAPGGPRLVFGGAAAREVRESTGIGDLFLRAKYRVWDRDPVHAAAGLVLGIPTGDQEHLRGTGFFEVSPALYLSTRTWEPAPWARLQGHLNTQLGFDTEAVSKSEARWALGLDWGVTEGMTAAVAFVGRHPFARLAPPGAFDFLRCRPNLATCVTSAASRYGREPLFGLSGDRPDYYDFSAGGRVSLWRDTVIAFANVIVPLNDEGIRTGPIPLVGLEATF